MAGVQVLPRPIPRLGDLDGFLALLGASVVVFYVVGEPKPSVHVGYALAGFLLWLVGVVLMLVHIQRPQYLKRLFFSGPGVHKLLRPIPRLGDLNGFLALLGASVVVSSVVGEPKPSVHTGYALAGFLLWLVGVVLMLLHIQGPQYLKRLFFSGPGAHELLRPIPRLGDLNGFLALLGASVVVSSVVGEPKPSVHAGYALAGFLLWLVGVVLMLLHIQGPQYLKRLFFSGPGAHELLRPIPRLGDLNGFLALLGASVVVSSVVGEPKPSVHAGYALAGFLLWLVGVVLMLLHIQGPQYLKRLFSSGPEAHELLRPIPRLGDLDGFLALLGASMVVFSVVGKPKSPVHVGCALAGFLLWLVGVMFMLLHRKRPQYLKRLFSSGPEAPAPVPTPV